MNKMIDEELKTVNGGGAGFEKFKSVLKDIVTLHGLCSPTGPCDVAAAVFAQKQGYDGLMCDIIHATGGDSEKYHQYMSGRRF